MKVVICQGKSLEGLPSREKLIEYWGELLKGCGHIKEIIYKTRFDPDKADEIIEDADALVGAWIHDDYFTMDFFKKYPKLKYISTFAHGYGRIDKKAARELGVTITNTIYGDVTIAQFAMALLLDICHNIRNMDRYYKEALDKGMILGPRGEMPVKTRQMELYGKTMGIIGLGSIGLWTAKMAAGFGMKIVATSRRKKEGPEYDFIEQVSIDEVFKRSDVISLHCPLTDETKGLINKDSIEKMKDGVVLINTARGPIINEPDLIEALNSGKIYAAGLDVVENEPLKERCDLMNCSNAVITPHIAWMPAEARYRSIKVASENLKNWMNNKPTSVII